MKKQVIAAAFSALAALTLSFSAGAAQTLEQLHQGSWPVSKDGFATKGQCMKCHGDYPALVKKTARDSGINPHYSHLGEVNCVECHKPGQEKPELMCNQCHKFEAAPKK